jgi:hypothetical protein
MRSVPASRAGFPHLTGIGSALLPALRHFAMECGAVATCVAAYMAVLAVVAIGAVAVVLHWNFADSLAELHLDTVPISDAPHNGWRLAPHASPAFAVSQFDTAGATASYEVFLNQSEGRRDVLRWTAGQAPLAGLRIDRPSTELPASGTVAVLMEAGLDLDRLDEAQAAGMVESKFGPVRLLSLIDRTGIAAPCLGFAKVFGSPSLRFEGWSCQGETAAAERAAIVCLLNRLVLLKAGNDAGLAELFARAELRRTDCTSEPGREAGDWIVSAQNPRLRGAL